MLATHQELCYIHEMLSVVQSCLILCDPMDWTCQGPLSMEFSQARVLKWVVISYSSVSSQPRDWTCIFCIFCRDRQILYHWTMWEAPYPWNTGRQKIYSFSLGLTLQKFVMVLHKVRIVASQVCGNSFFPGHWNFLFTFLILYKFCFLCSKSTWFFLYGWFAALNSERPLYFLNQINIHLCFFLVLLQSSFFTFKSLIHLEFIWLHCYKVLNSYLFKTPS